MKKMFLLLLPAAFMIQSCGKQCNDPNASNYSADDKKNKDCTYEATITFWYNQAKSISWDQAGVTGLNFYVGEVLVGSGNNDVGTYWVTAPTCADSGTINVTKNLGSETAKTIAWQVKDQSNNVLASGSWSATGGGCDVVKVE